MKIEMHVHTSEGSPCAKVGAEDIVKAYAQAGYGAVVITNHFDSLLLKEFGNTGKEQIERYLLGYRKAKAVEKQYDIKVMLGVEVRLEPDAEDFLIYGIDEAFLFKTRIFVLKVRKKSMTFVIPVMRCSIRHIHLGIHVFRKILNFWME